MTQSRESGNNNDRQKNLIALGCITLTVLGLIVGMMSRKPIGDSFSPGTIMTLIAFLASMGSVKDRGSNALAMTAFMGSFVAMTVTIFLGRF